MDRDDLRAFKRLLSPERLWLLSIRLHRSGRWRWAFIVKQLNSLIYHNSLAPGASVSPDVSLGHNGLGIVIHSDVEIGRDVMIWHNVTLVAGRKPRRGGAEQATNGSGPASERRSRIIIEDHVTIGANAVLIAPRGETMRIGRGARIGAGTVVTESLPNRSTLIGAPNRLLDRPKRRGNDDEPTEVEHSG
jgi:serine O-acetyltransferase